MLTLLLLEVKQHRSTYIIHRLSCQFPARRGSAALAACCYSIFSLYLRYTHCSTLQFKMAPPISSGKQPAKNNGISTGLTKVQPRKISTAPSTTQYQEIQEDELIALASIYGDDFLRIETNHGAWKVCEHVSVTHF